MANDVRSVHFQIMWNRLISVVEEQALTLVRTAFSTAVRESGDLSAGIFDSNGHMMAQAVTGTPGHVNAMAEAVGNFIDAIGADNVVEETSTDQRSVERYRTCARLHRCIAVFRQKILVGYLASTAHLVDVGGRGLARTRTKSTRRASLSRS